jgi:ADP-ribose pyrophosphatase
MRTAETYAWNEGPMADEKILYRGRQFQVAVRERRRDDGRAAVIERVVRSPAVAVLAEYEGAVVLIRQYRPAVGLTLWELPAGRIDPGETPEAAAERELMEETGYRAHRLVPVFRYFPSPGYTTEEVHLFWAPSTTPGEAHPEPGESLTVTAVRREQLLQLLAAGEVRNGLLLTGVLWWLERDRLRIVAE